MQTKDKPITSIQPYHFFNSEQEKTKLNWFSFELACEIDKAIPADMRKYLRKKGYSESDYYAACIKLAKLLQKPILRKIKGEAAEMVIGYRLVEEAFPKLNQTSINKLLDYVGEAWDNITGICVTCPEACLTNRDKRALMFNDPYYYDEPETDPEKRAAKTLSKTITLLNRIAKGTKTLP